MTLKKAVQLYNKILKDINDIERKLAKCSDAAYAQYKPKFGPKLESLRLKEAQLGDELEIAESEGKVKWVHRDKASFLTIITGR